MYTTIYDTFLPSPCGSHGDVLLRLTFKKGRAIHLPLGALQSVHCQLRVLGIHLRFKATILLSLRSLLLMTGQLHLVQDAHNGQSLPWCSLSGSPKRIRSAGLWPNPSSSFLCSWESDMHCDPILPLLHFIVHGHHLKRIT